jgi:hypothetical protein
MNVILYGGLPGSRIILSSEPTENGDDLTAGVIPNTRPHEALSTILLACRALNGVVVGENGLVGFTSARAMLEAAGRVGDCDGICHLRACDRRVQDTGR